MHYCLRGHHLFSTTDLPVHAQTCPLSSSDISVIYTGTNSPLLQMSCKERFDWSQAEGARTVKRKLYLQHDDFGHCEHCGFNSKRGCRKHIDTKHSWFYFFDEKSAVQLNRYISDEGTADCTWAIRKKANTRKIPHFPVNEGIGKDFVSWLSSACGRGVAENQAKQQSVRITKFLKYCSEDDEDEVSRDFVDYCNGSPCLVSKFIEHSREEWSLTRSAQINYLQAIADMIDMLINSKGLLNPLLEVFHSLRSAFTVGREHYQTERDMSGPKFRHRQSGSHEQLGNTGRAAESCTFPLS